VDLLSALAPEETDAASDAPAGMCQSLAPDVCNDGDDGCSGGGDGGCAVTVLWTADAPSAFLGHATGGVNFQAPCPQGSVLAGLHAGMGSWLNMVAGACKAITFDLDAQGVPAVVGLGAEVDTSYAPASSTDMKNQVHDLVCPEGLVLSGIDGTAASVEARYIYGLQVRCAPPVVTTAAGASVLSVDLSREQALEPIVCVSCPPTQAFNFTATAPAGEIATGVFGGDGLWDDRVGFQLSSAVLNPP
jgi:hypothetical protein